MSLTEFASDLSSHGMVNVKHMRCNDAEGFKNRMKF